MMGHNESLKGPTTRPEAIRFCECPEGAYHGAQLVGTAPLCERCKRLPDEPWVHAALLAALVRAGYLHRAKELTTISVELAAASRCSPREALDALVQALQVVVDEASDA